MSERKKLDFSNDFTGKVIDWTLGRPTIYYRDSPLSASLIDKYQVGTIFRAPTFVDVSSVAGKPTKSCRFLIASSHAAPIFRLNPQTEKWKLHTINCNSVFKILDVYVKDGIVQIFLLHIPYNGRHIFENTRLIINEENIEQKLISTARANLDAKMNFQTIPVFEEKAWMERTDFPIGLNMENHFYPMLPAGPLLPEAQPLYTAIRKITEDLTSLNEIEMEE